MCVLLDMWSYRLTTGTLWCNRNWQRLGTQDTGQRQTKENQNQEWTI